ncbi:hypothetical protein ACFPOE_15780 [Caenimonas terrae]|uniref:Uncharacterized protein n=1 Tax=Caenimonas terrae TaxID=696074 RepID=A0ABW0NIW8_9BURK
MDRDVCIRSRAGQVLLALASLASPWAAAQSYCSSDGQTQPARLLERFISADCESCWAGGTEPAQPDELALDWIVPGGRGEEAPLSAAASRDALARLAALGRQPPVEIDAARLVVQAPRRGLRVSHGLPFNGYLGTSLELKSPDRQPWSAWLLLVETIPAGSDGTPIERNLVRNALQLAWPAAAGQARLFEARPMNIPEGAHPDRLRVVGWVQDGRGRMRAIAQSRCAPAGAGG